MAQQTISIGINPNDGTGDPLRTSFIKTNQNFTELYGNISAPAGANGEIQYQNFGALAGAPGLVTDGGNLVITGTTTLQQTIELSTISGISASGTIDVDMLTSGTHYYTTNASSTWIFNIRGSGAVTLDSLLAIGDTTTLTFLVTNGGTAYYPTSITVDSAGATVRWIGGAPSSGTINSIESYTMTVVKTAAATFTVLATQSPFVA